MNIRALSEKNEKIAYLLELNHSLFSNLFVVYLFLLLAETIQEGSVSIYMAINYLLIIVIASGIISVLTRSEDVKPEKVDPTKKDYVYIGAMGIAGASIIWYKTKNIGELAYLISVIAGVLIILFPLLLFEEDENDD